MNFTIENKEKFTVYGIEKIFTMEDGKNLIEIPKFWDRVMNDGTFKVLLDSTKGTSGVHAIYQYRETGEDTFPYMIFAYKTNESNLTGYTQVDVPAGTWAIFKSRNHTQEEVSSVIQELIKRVYTEWLPTSEYEKSEGYDLELYFQTEDGMCYCETWIRVSPKNI